MSRPSAPSRATGSAPLRLALWHESLLCAVIVALTVSGGVWLVYHHLLPLNDSIATHPAETWSLRLHGGLAMLALVMVGALLPRHVLPAWGRRLNRNSGGAMLGAMLFLTLTGYLLYYAGSPSLREVVSVLHWVAGLALPLLLALHMALGGRWRR